ncbi:MAG: Fe-S cluster assembly protein SufD [Gammaproteobacteria bacterium]|nr:Fe-S cluster assembly protein SufD [Gammaproteobacteria bacterium]
MTRSTVQQAVTGEPGIRPPWQVAAEQPRPDTPGLDWFAGRQAAARARIVQSGLPEPAEEDWRYTSLASFARRWGEYLSAPAGAVVPEAGDPAPGRLPVGGHGVTVNIVNGVLRSLPVDGGAGLTIRSLGQLTADLRGRAENLLLKTDKTTPDKLVDLNTALLGDAILIATEPGCSPPEALHVRLKAGTARLLSQPRLLVDLAPDSQLTLILEHTGGSGALVNAVSQMSLGRGSQLNLIRVQTLPDDGMLLDTTDMELAESASLTVTSVDLGGQLCRQTIAVRLAGPGASATVNGVFLADGKRHIDNHTRLLHQAPGTTSREFFRGIADGHGRGVFNGKIIVMPGAAGSNAALTNRNLLLAPTAEIDTKPELEIYVDDVRCSHGATTGQLDPNALFYLRSRGLDPAIAREVLTSAFLREGLSGIVIPELRLRLEAQLQARLGGEPASKEPGATK